MHTHLRVGRACALALALLTGAAAASPTACALEDCSLALAWHQVEARAPAGWAWMAHDLALARHSARSGHAAAALQQARALDAALVAQLPWIDRAGGEAWARDLHRALALLVVSLDGAPLADLPSRLGPAMPGA
jgi:hypothetical protein